MCDVRHHRWNNHLLACRDLSHFWGNPCWCVRFSCKQNKKRISEYYHSFSSYSPSENVLRSRSYSKYSAFVSSHLDNRQLSDQSLCIQDITYQQFIVFLDVYHSSSCYHWFFSLRSSFEYVSLCQPYAFWFHHRDYAHIYLDSQERLIFISIHRTFAYAYSYVLHQITPSHATAVTSPSPLAGELSRKTP